MKFGSPWFSIIAFFSAFVFSEALYYYIIGFSYPNLEQAINDFFLTFSIASFLSVTFILFSKRRVVNESGSSLNFGCNVKVIFVGNSLVFITSFLILIGLKNGVNPLNDPLSFRQIIQGGGNSYFLILFLFLFKLFGVCYLESLYLKRSSAYLHLITVFTVFFCFVSGFTSLFVYLFLSGLIYLNVRYSFRVVRLPIVFLFFLLIIFTPFYTVYRELKKSGISVDYNMILAHFDKVDSNIFKIIFDRFDYFDNFVVGSYYARINQDFSKVFDFFLQPLPRSLFPDKPFNFSTTMTSYVYPSNLDIGVTANFGFINEFVLYFGDYGPLFAGFFLSFLTVVVYKIYLKSKYDGRICAYYSVVLLPYFMSFPIGYFNDMGLPSFILSTIFWFVFSKKIYKS